MTLPLQNITPNKSTREFIDAGFEHIVNVRWGRSANTAQQWDHICDWSIDMFGLPGDRYTWHPSHDNMIWRFRLPQDAILFTLKFGEATC